MSVDGEAAEREELGISLDELNIEGLEKAIQRKLLPLQSGDLSANDREQQRKLTDALISLQREHDPHKQLVAVSAESVSDLVTLAVGNSPESNVTGRMRRDAQVAATQARKDFRNARTLPFAGLGAVAAFVWTQRESFGVDLSGVGNVYFAVGTGGVFVVAFCFYVLARRTQERDERTLRALYRPEAQASALKVVTGLHGSTEDHSDSKLDREPSFSVIDYRDALDYFARYGPRHEDYFPHRRRWPPYGPRPSLHTISTVDLKAALEDAAELALERFIKLGAIEPIDSWSGTEYRATQKLLASGEH